MIPVLILGMLAFPTIPPAIAATDGPGNPASYEVGIHPSTLVELVDQALQRNPETRVAWDAFRSSEAGVSIARAGYWPQIGATVSAQRGRALNFSGNPAPTQTRYGASVSLSYLLWDFGTRSGLLHQAEFQRDFEELSKDQTLQDVILQVEQAYYQVLGLRAVVAANRQSLHDAETNLASVHERRSSGLATVGDVYKAEATLAGSQLSLQQAEGQLAVARGQLAVAVGSPPDTPLALAAWERETDRRLPAQGIESLLAEARHARPELLAAIAQEKAAVANLEAVRGRGLPTLSFGADTGGTRVAGIGTSSQFNTLVSLNIPIFSGFGDEAATQQAEIQRDSAMANIDTLRSQVELEVWQAYQNLRAAAVSIDSSKAQLKSAQQAADVSTARYSHGLDTILDLLSAQTVLANARVQEVQSRLDWAVARAALGHAVGGLHVSTPASEPESP
jgi:outer membrane protein